MNFLKKINIFIIVIVYVTITVFFIFAKRTEFSYEERRATRNIFSFNNGENIQSEFEKNFIDSIPERDKIINLSIYLKSFKGINDENGIAIINTSNKVAYNKDVGATTDENLLNDENENIEDQDLNDKFSDEVYEIVDVLNSTNKVLVVGENEKVRGLNIYHGRGHISNDTIITNLNKFAKVLDNKYNLYFMMIPIPCAYYTPAQLENTWVDQKKEINSIYDNIEGYTCVDIYDNLEIHKNENIYFRTDSHWAQLGAYYAGEVFAKIANLKYPSIDNYNKFELENYCSSFYRYTEDQRFKKNPEVFVYYEPKINYKVKQIFYKKDTIDGEYYIDKVVENAKYFKPEYYSSSYYYLLYMGGDENTTIVKMPDNDTKRKLVLIKDSYGNALAPNLFYSFDEIHVIDFRYFVGNLKEYLETNEITDILISSQIGIIYSAAQKYNILLEQDNN